MNSGLVSGIRKVHRDNRGLSPRTAIVVAAVDASSDEQAGADLICAGSDDDRTVLQAINALPSNGGTVRLTEGTYRWGFNSMVPTRGNWTLEGADARYTIVRAPPTSTAVSNYILSTSTTTKRSNITIRGIQFDGNYNNGAGNISFGMISLWGDNITVSDCLFTNFRSSGFAISTASSSVLADNVRVYRNRFDGNPNNGTSISLYAVQNSIIAHNEIEGNLGGIATGDGNSIEGARVIVSDNIVRSAGGSAGAAISIGTATYAVVSGNLVSAYGQGLAIIGQYHTVTGNTFSGNNSSGIGLGGNGILKDSVISGNVIRSAFTYGIEVLVNFPALTNVAIEGNVITNCNFHGMSLQGTHIDTCIRNNLISSNSQSSNLGYDGIYLAQTHTRTFIANNKIFRGSGANKQRYGINLSASTVSSTTMVGNENSLGGSTANVNDAGASTVNMPINSYAPRNISRILYR